MSPPARTRNHRTAAIAFVLLVIGICVSGLWIAASGGFAALGGIVKVSPLMWAALIGMTTFHLLIRFVRWQYLLRRVGIRLPTRRSLITYLASLVGAGTPAYVGEALRCVFVKRNHGTPIKTTLSILALERLLDIAALGVIGVITAESLAMAALLGLFVIVAVLLGLGLLRLARYSAFPLEPSLTMPSASLMFSGFVFSLTAWGIAAMTPAIAASALSQSLSIQESARIFSQSTLLGGVSLMPAGFGATGTAAVFQLQSLGFTQNDALPIVALFRWSTTGFALSAGVVFLLLELRAARKSSSATAVEHFDEIAVDYERQYAPHIWKLLLDRKVNLLAGALPSPPVNAGVGLDFGCGLGQQAAAMRERGFRVIGMDPSVHLLAKGGARGEAVAGDGLHLPFGNNTFDFVYTIGVLHHLPGREAQDSAVREIHRVLKPGGHLLVLETNTRNPLFVFYMGYVFPIVKTIDEGTEQWVAPGRFTEAPGFRVAAMRYFTFLPDTIPKFLLGAFLALERKLERSPLAPYAVHYMAVLQKETPRAT
ncbi:MAG: lysylphosphatidylglycerol synthase domain-containing protein [Planctomycetota bacterium]